MSKHKLQRQTRPREIVWCEVCGGAEESLPTECPGVTMSPVQIDVVHEGALDYWNNEWCVPDEDTRREEVAKILETIAKDGLPGPRDLDAALDAIFQTIEGE